MKILLDEGVPKQIARHLSTLDVTTVPDAGWASAKNGILLDLVEWSGFNVFLTCDNNLEYQQSELKCRSFHLLVLSTNHWPSMEPHVQAVVEAVKGYYPGAIAKVECGHFVPRKFRKLLVLALACTLAHAQRPKPAATLAPLTPGLTLPVILGRALHAGSTQPGTPIAATTTQRVFLDPHTFLKAGARLLGTVVASTNKPATLTLRFDTLAYARQSVPIAVDALAIANFTDVSDTLAPANGGTDRGNSNPASWTTRQIGGDEVARSGWIGPVVDSTMHTVGSADFYGVYADPPAGSATPLALGPFSSTARGPYDLNEGAAIRSRNGAITITAPRSLVLRRGDALLLQVTRAAP